MKILGHARTQTNHTHAFALLATLVEIVIKVRKVANGIAIDL